MAVTVEARKEVWGANRGLSVARAGNPAAGREHGTAKEVRDYFNKCVANKGNIDEQPLEPGTTPKLPRKEAIRTVKLPKKGGPSQTA